MKDPHYWELRALAAEADLQIEKQQHAIARAKLEDLQHEYAGGIEMGMRATAEQQGRIVSLEARLARVVEAMEHALEWLEEEGCDCGTDEPNTCALCHAKQVLAAAKEER